MWFLLTSGAVTAAAASYAGYATMAPGSQLYGRTLVQGADPSQIALTYDDGPNDPHTLHLLDVLDRHQAKATFFLIGKFVRERPEIARAIQAAGHAVGNHTYSHPILIFLSAAAVKQELEDCNKALEDTLGASPTLFRPPFGGRRPVVLQTARSLGLTPVMWSVTAYDWSATSADSIVQKVERRIDVQNSSLGQVVLLHDGGHLAMSTDRSHTVEATRILLNKYSAAGKKFVAIPDLALPDSQKQI